VRARCCMPPDRHDGTGGGTAWKSPRMVTLLDAYGGRLAIEATMEPPVTVSRNQGAESAG